MVKAKFRCRSVSHMETSSPTDACAEIKLYAVYGDGKGNESWSKATPQGDLTMLVTNPPAIDYFAPGRDYYITFDEAERPGRSAPRSA